MESTYNDKKYLTFKPLSYVPIQADLCVADMLDARGKKWLKEYNSACYEKMSALVEDASVLQWVKDQAEKAALL